MSDFNALDLEGLDALLDAAEVGTEADDDLPELESTESMPEVEAIEPVEEKSVEPMPATEPAKKQQLNAEQDAPRKSPPSLKASKSTAQQWTDAEMDAVKKLVIIFGSIISFLVVIAIALASVGLFSGNKADPLLLEQVEEIKSEVDQSYLLLEDSGKQNKIISGQLSDVATQLAEINEIVEILQSKQNSPVVAVETGKQMSAAERKAALRAEIKNNLSVDRGDSLVADVAEVSTEEVEVVQQPVMMAKNVQVEQLQADLTMVKKHLLATQKVLEGLFKQSEMLNQQSQELNETLKNVETDVKALKPVKVSVPKPVAVKKEVVKPAEPVVVKQVKPADDPEFRQRWSREMSKTDGFP